jgi:hypothetical protein
MKTKNKLDHLKLVMQQKKERREARKLKIAPYNINSQLVNLGTQLISTIPFPIVSANDSMNESLTGMPSTLTTNHLNTSSDSNSSSSATATAAIATSIATSNSEIENHLEEVDTVA